LDPQKIKPSNSLEEAKEFLLKDLQTINDTVQAFPEIYYPDDYFVFVSIMHPERTKKIYTPRALFSSMGVQQINYGEEEIEPRRFF
jgi:hypothetical protein